MEYDNIERDVHANFEEDFAAKNRKAFEARFDISKPFSSTFNPLKPL